MYYRDKFQLCLCVVKNYTCWKESCVEVTQKIILKLFLYFINTYVWIYNLEFDMKKQQITKKYHSSIKIPLKNILNQLMNIINDNI